MDLKSSLLTQGGIRYSSSCDHRWRRAEISQVSIYTYNTSTSPSPEEVAALTRLWAGMSHADRKALLLFARYQAEATVLPAPLAKSRLH